MNLDKTEDKTNITHPQEVPERSRFNGLFINVFMYDHAVATMIMGKDLITNTWQWCL